MSENADALPFDEANDGQDGSDDDTLGCQWDDDAEVEEHSSDDDEERQFRIPLTRRQLDALVASVTRTIPQTP